MAFEARYEGTCSKCWEEIKPGQMIREERQGSYQHVVCPEPEPEPTPDVCPRCFMVKSVNGTCDGCDE